MTHSCIPTFNSKSSIIYVYRDFVSPSGNKVTKAAALLLGNLEKRRPLRTHFTLPPINEGDGAGCYPGPIVSSPRRQSRLFLTVTKELPRGEERGNENSSLSRKGFSVSRFSGLSFLLSIYRATRDDTAGSGSVSQGKTAVSSLADRLLRF